MAIPRRIIIDVDVGTDDYLVLLILLHAEKRGQVQIDAIVCTSGNTNLENVCRNVIRLLEIVNRTNIPVYRGARKPLIPPNLDVPPFHGEDGFGGLKYDKEPDLSVIKTEPAAVAIAKLVLKNPNEISLICVGPLTNLALAIRLYDKFADSIKDLWIMGGNYTALGNITATAEFNFYYDPEAAFIALESITQPVHILTWETCLHSKISMEWRFEVFGAKPNPEIQLLTQAEKSVYHKSVKNWLPCDAFLAAAFVAPDEIITRTSSHNASVELHGWETRGQVVLDHKKSKKENVRIIETIDEGVFKRLLLEL